MTTQDLTLMQAALQKMRWHEARQKVLSANIANADTAGYKPQDIAPLDFKDLLSSSTSTLSLGAASAGSAAAPAVSGVPLATTNARHLTGGGSAGGAVPDSSASFARMQAPKNQRQSYEITPTGNAVVLEEQLMKMNQNYTDHRLTTTIYQKNVDMLKAALRSQ